MSFLDGMGLDKAASFACECPDGCTILGMDGLGLTGQRDAFRFPLSCFRTAPGVVPRLGTFSEYGILRRKDDRVFLRECVIDLPSTPSRSTTRIQQEGFEAHLKSGLSDE
jgi:hypothetical protein